MREEIDLDQARDFHHHNSRLTPGPTPQEVDPEVEEQAGSLLSHLTPLQRQVLELRAMAGMRHKDIGAIVWPDLEPWRSTQRSSAAHSAALAKLRKLADSPEHIASIRERKEDEIRSRTVSSTKRTLSRSLGDALTHAIIWVNHSALDTTRSGASHSI